MIKVSREWATPLTIGLFLLMGVTGLLMFFHWDNSLQKTLHEWLRWLMVAAAVVHALANWLPDDEASLASAVGKDRERLGAALKALAQAGNGKLP